MGKDYLVMIEGKVADENAYVGRTYADAPGIDGYMFINTGELLMSGDFVKAHVTGSLEYDLIGEIADDTPNKLTMLRIILIPFFVVFLLGNFSAWSKWMALAIFVIASLTDMLDGYLARRDNLVTNFGKFMDPLADKLLVCSAMICLVDMSRIPSWIVIIIIGREFVISGFRLIASDNGVVIAANYWGKCKTVCQMFMIIILIANLGGGFVIVEQILIYASLILTVISLITYLWQNRSVLSMQE